ncbi:MAG: PKD domain-containing protein [Candidatus Eisenbacteria bacterium]
MVLLLSCSKDSCENPNTPPTASFTVNPTSGTTDTLFQFDASSCSDPEDPMTALQVRWDWENDGTWDTQWSATKTASHQYGTAGTKTINLEVTDTGGLSDDTTQTVNAGGFACYPDLPIPQLQVTRKEDYEWSGEWWTRYYMTVNNRSVFPSALFEVAPDLPPCGLNSNASRTWVDIYNQDGGYLSGFCGLTSAEHLDGIWFALPKEQAPPPFVYITMVDRRCGITYTSNLASTSYGNTAPIASFTVNPTSGTTATVFQFDASSSSDTENPVSALQVRWDWENDGTWDTDWSTAKTASHQYSTPGTKTIRLEVKDTEGAVDDTTGIATVSIPVPYEVYDRYSYCGPTAESDTTFFFHTTSKIAFDSLFFFIFDHNTRDTIPSADFSTKSAISIVKYSNDYYDLTVKAVRIRAETLDVQYTSTLIRENIGWYAAIPIIVMTDAVYHKIRFLENGQQIKELDLSEGHKRLTPMASPGQGGKTLPLSR